MDTRDGGWVERKREEERRALLVSSETVPLVRGRSRMGRMGRRWLWPACGAWAGESYMYSSIYIHLYDYATHRSEVQQPATGTRSRPSGSCPTTASPY
jgi:hypothetical protein